MAKKVSPIRCYFEKKICFDCPHCVSDYSPVARMNIGIVCHCNPWICSICTLLCTNAWSRLGAETKKRSCFVLTSSFGGTIMAGNTADVTSLFSKTEVCSLADIHPLHLPMTNSAHINLIRTTSLYKLLYNSYETYECNHGLQKCTMPTFSSGDWS